MFHKVNVKNQPKPIALNKPQSSYKKLEKEMNEPPKEYNSIKKLIEQSTENSIKDIDKMVSIKNVKLLPHKKQNK